MEKEKKSHAKIIWVSALVVLTVLLCYLFVNIYFFYISPNNISVKLGFFPLLSDKSVASYELDATMQIDFVANNEYGDPTEKSIVGVNLRRDGFVVTAANEFDGYAGDQITISANDGNVFQGKLLFKEEHYNLAILKCENVKNDGKTQKVDLPFVSFSNYITPGKILAVTSPLESKDAWVGNVSEDISVVCDQIFVEGSLATKYVMGNCYDIELADATSYLGGAAFDRNGFLLGLTLALEDDQFALLPVYPIREFFEDVVDAYYKDQTFEVPLTKCFTGFDVNEIICHMATSLDINNGGRMNEFYLDGAWQEYPADINSFVDEEINFFGGYYLFRDFQYNNVKIDAGNVLTAIEIGGERYEISSKYDLFSCLYSIKNEKNMKMCYINLNLPANEQMVEVAI